MNKPNFLIVGLARSGTTSLYYYLKQHPEIYLPKVKAPKYFSSINRMFPHRGKGDESVDSSRIYSQSEYLNLFKEVKNETAIGEASSDYFFYIDECLLEILDELGPHINIIICLRNPYDRAYSAYNNLLRDSRELFSFEQGLKIEKERMRKNFDWMWFYLNGSLYHDKLEKIMNTFHNTHVIYFDDIENNTPLVLKNVCNFLNVDCNFQFDSDIIYSSSGKPKNLLFKYLSKRYGPIFWIRKQTLKLFPRNILERISRSFFKKGNMGENEIKLMKKKLNEDIDKLISLLENEQLKKWRR